MRNTTPYPQLPPALLCGTGAFGPPWTPESGVDCYLCTPDFSAIGGPRLLNIGQCGINASGDHMAKDFVEDP